MLHSYKWLHVQPVGKDLEVALHFIHSDFKSKSYN